MKTYFKVSLYVLLMTSLLLAACGQGSSTTQPSGGSDASSGSQETVRLTLGSMASSSSNFPLWIKLAEIINENTDGIDATTIESPGAARENADRLEKKEIQIGMTADSTLFVAKNENGHTSHRGLLWYHNAHNGIFVTQESGINSVAELDGQPYAPGYSGSTTEKQMLDAFKAIGVQPKYFQASLDDQVEAIKNREIVGYSKTVNGNQADATYIDITSTIPMKVIGFTPEEAKKIETEVPSLRIGTIPANSYEGQTEDVLALYSYVGMSTNDSLPEEVGYQVVKAIWENWDQIVEISPDSKSITPQLILDNPPVYPLHAGAVRYYREMGFEVPEELVPPEMK